MKALHKDPKIAANRQRWLDYLRDEGRRKTEGCLEDPIDDGFENPRCCLGHACALFKDELNLSVKETSFNNIDSVYYNEQKTSLPIEVQEHLDINGYGSLINPLTCDDMDCDINSTDEFCSLADINDRTDLTPEQIADYIEHAMIERNLVDHEPT